MMFTRLVPVASRAVLRTAAVRSFASSSTKKIDIRQCGIVVHRRGGLGATGKVHAPGRVVATRAHSSGASPMQVKLWDQYLTDQDGDVVHLVEDLFKSIDVDHSGKISVQEIQDFLDSIGRKGIDESEVDELVELGMDHELTRNEFTIWLAGAVNPDGDYGGTEDHDEMNHTTDTSSGASPMQAKLWSQYLTDQDGDVVHLVEDLFKSIDVDNSGKISVQEIQTFLDSIGRRGIDESEVDELVELGMDHELTPNEFTIWLAGAVNPDGDYGGTEDHDEMNHNVK